MNTTHLLYGLIALVAAPLLGGLLAGLDRILTARMQGRVGPPLLQPFYDVAKLFQKQGVSVSHFQAFYVACFVLFTALATGLFFGGNDLLLVVFALTAGGVFLVLGAFSPNSPYSNIGAERELLQMLAYEPMLLIAIMGLYLVAGSAVGPSPAKADATCCAGKASTAVVAATAPTCTNPACSNMLAVVATNKALCDTNTACPEHRALCLARMAADASNAAASSNASACAHGMPDATACPHRGTPSSEACAKCAHHARAKSACAHGAATPADGNACPHLKACGAGAPASTTGASKATDRNFLVSTILANGARPELGWKFLAKLGGIFLGFLFILTIKLRKSPFDLSTSHHGHQEIVKGLTTEFSGRTLAFIEIGHWYENILLMGFVGLFFCWAHPLVALALMAAVYFLEILIDNASARLKWQTMVKSAWIVTLVLGVGNLVILYYFQR